MAAPYTLSPVNIFYDGKELGNGTLEVKSTRVRWFKEDETGEDERGMKYASITLKDMPSKDAKELVFEFEKNEDSTIDVRLVPEDATQISAMYDAILKAKEDAGSEKKVEKKKGRGRAM